MPYCRSALAALLLISLPTAAHAKTWVNGQSTPDVEELVVVDATGEDHWVYGKEDLAGDGQSFGLPEASADVRTAYAAADPTRLWARAYVSSEAAPGSDVIVYVFVDTDQNVLTGGSSAATEIDPRFTFDTGGGGFEHCFAIRGNGTMHGLWHYTEVTNAFQPENLLQAEAVAEVGTDSDPILAGGLVHGYLQGSIDHDKIGTTAGCQVRLYLRSLDATTKRWEMEGPASRPT